MDRETLEKRVAELTAEIAEVKRQVQMLEDAYSAPSDKGETWVLQRLEATLERLTQAARLKLYPRRDEPDSAV